MKTIVRILTIALLLLIAFRLGPRLFAFFVRFWSIPILLIIWFSARQRMRDIARKKRNSNLDPDKEILVDQDKKR